MNSANPVKWIPTAYFAMGLPYVALSLASVIMFADLGIDPASITFWTSLLLLPYTIKPIWSPLLELYFTKKAFAVSMQVIVGLCFAAISFMLGNGAWFGAVLAMMFMISFAGATDDIAVDGIYLTALDKTTQAKYIGWQGAFYNLAKVLVNGGLVYLAGVLMKHFANGYGNAPLIAWRIIVGIMASIMIIVAVYHIFFLPRGSVNEETTANFRIAMRSLWDVFRDFFTKRHIWFSIVFIVCYRLTEGFAIKIVPLFLKAGIGDGGLGLSNEKIGFIYGTLGTIAFIVGSILSGYYTAHFGLKKVIFSLVCIFNLPFVLYYLLAVFQPANIVIVATALVVEYLCYGFGFVGLTLFMMQQVAAGPHPMAHYSFASGIMNLGFMLPGMISGWTCNLLGFENFFLLALFMSVPAFILVLKLPFNKTSTQNAN